MHVLLFLAQAGLQMELINRFRFMIIYSSKLADFVGIVDRYSDLELNDEIFVR